MTRWGADGLTCPPLASLAILIPWRSAHTVAWVLEITGTDKLLPIDQDDPAVPSTRAS